MLCSDSLLKSRPQCQDHGCDSRGKSRAFAHDSLFHEYLQPFYGEATNIEDIHTFMNWTLQDPRPSTVQNDRVTNLPGTNYDNT